MNILVRYSYWEFGPIEGGSYNPTIRSFLKTKNLIFHHIEDVDNWLRNKVSARLLIKLEIEYLTVE
jgi:hypothetical protein